MSKTTAEIPYTELVERAIQMARVNSTNDRSRARAAVNDMYCRVLPAREDWSFLLATSAITCDASYITGTVSINTQDTVATFSTDVTLPTMSRLPWKIKFSQNNNVYDFTRANNTGGTIAPPLSGTQNITNWAYTVYQDTYYLAPDFDRFPKNGGLLLYQGGKRTPIKESTVQKFFSDTTPSPSVPGTCQILLNYGTGGIPAVVLDPPPKDPLVIPYFYLQTVKPMRETTAGFADIAISATAVIGSAGTTRFTEVTSGSYFRITAFGTEEDSEWYRTTAVPTNSSATLSVVFGLSGATTAAYVLCDAPKMPAKLHLAILYGATKILLADQNDPNFKYADSLEREIMTEARRTYKTRIYDQEIDTIATDWQYRR